MSEPEYEACFAAMLEEYGEDALWAIRNGYVKFEETRAGTRPEPQA